MASDWLILLYDCSERCVVFNFYTSSERCQVELGCAAYRRHIVSWKGEGKIRRDTITLRVRRRRPDNESGSRECLKAEVFILKYCLCDFIQKEVMLLCTSPLFKSKDRYPSDIMFCCVCSCSSLTKAVENPVFYCGIAVFLNVTHIQTSVSSWKTNTLGERYLIKYLRIDNSNASVY